ncbi:MAG: hypothetical protein WD176_06975, partial [Pirellulales bacterium]
VEAIGPLPTLHAVIVKPPVALATADVYRRCRAAAVPWRVDPVVAAWKKGDIGKLGSLLANRLEPAAEELSPWMARVRSALCETSAVGWGMTGSGSSWFALCNSARHARRLAQSLRARGLGYAACAAVMAC